MNKLQAIDAARNLLQVREEERKRLDPLADAMKPWTTENAASKVFASTKTTSAETNKAIAARSQRNFLPLVLDVFSQGMKVDNYLASATKDASPAWVWWQKNGFDARQTGVHRAALHYGTSYVVVLPSMAPAGAPKAEGAFMRGTSPREMTTLYGEPMEWTPGGGPVDSDWPIMALEVKGNQIRVYDEEQVHFIGAKRAPNVSGMGWKDPALQSADNFDYIEGRAHGVGVCPVVRFRDRMLLDGEEQFGIIEPILGIQSNIDQTVFEGNTAQYWAAFKQRYVMGWMPSDEREAFRQAVSETWFFKDDDVKVGQFVETDLKPFHESKAGAIRDLAATAQIPAHALGLDGISNISEATLAALETGKERKSSEIETSFGESWEQVLRTAAFIAGDMVSAQDFASEVLWRDQSARSFAQTVDGLGKLATMLGVPTEALWEDIPGWTRQKADRARGMLDGGSGLELPPTS